MTQEEPWRWKIESVDSPTSVTKEGAARVSFLAQELRPLPSELDRFGNHFTCEVGSDSTVLGELQLCLNGLPKKPKGRNRFLFTAIAEASVVANYIKAPMFIRLKSSEETHLYPYTYELGTDDDKDNYFVRVIQKHKRSRLR